MTLVRFVNIVAVTLLVALASVVPATFVGRYLPGIFKPGIQQIAVAAWITGLATWYIATAVKQKEQDAARAAVKQTSGGSSAAVAVTFLALAAGIAAALHFYGDRLLG